MAKVRRVPWKNNSDSSGYPVPRDKFGKLDGTAGSKFLYISDYRSVVKGEAGWGKLDAKISFGSLDVLSAHEVVANLFEKMFQLWQLNFNKVPTLPDTVGGDGVKKNEWLEVYDKLQGFNDLNKMVGAIHRMELWIERGHCPPAVEYTCRFIHTMCQDPYFSPSQLKPESDTNLQVQYATSLLRFINILGEVASEKSLSLNARALKIGLPEWVVNTRHQISHGSCLPSLDILRISVESLLKWLKTNYWELEKEGMSDLIIPNSASLFEDKVNQLLEIYVDLTKESCQNTKLVRNIKNENVKKKVMELGDLLYHMYKQEVREWERTSMPSFGSVYQSKQLLNMTIQNAITLVVKTIKPYFDYERASAVKIFVDFLLMDCFIEGIRIEQWRQLLCALHAKGHFPSLLNEMVKHMCTADSETHAHAAEWTIFLLKSLLKRFKAQKKLDLISSNSVPTSKRMKLNLTEKEKTLITKDRVKHQLSIETGSHESDEVLAKLFEVIERKNPSLKVTLKLKDAKFLSEQEIIMMTHKIFLTPNKYTAEISELLMNMSNRLNKSAVTSLRDLMKLHIDMPIEILKKHSRVFDSMSLACFLLPQTQAHVLMETENFS